MIIEDIEVKKFADQPFCRDMSSDQVAALAAVLEKRRYPEGSVIFAEGKTDPFLFLLRDGSVELTVESEYGRNEKGEKGYPFYTFGAGDIFGYLTFLDGRPHSANAIARTETVVYVLKRADFERFMHDHPPTAFKIMQFIVLQVDDMARRMIHKFAQLSDYLFQGTGYGH
ncbi:MAG: hypothetical protein AUJ55_12540 [Proteobacteria bacterium CG1_02_64_396]|nr:MAG: hypothetical protein AUJ55_12540 [Proteobacteria bacterium CG1_02_64_396]